MSETSNKDKPFFSVGRMFFLLIVIPLSLMAILIANGIFKVGDSARERALTVLDQKSQEAIKVRAVGVADEAADFLREREKDLLVATIIPTSEVAFRDFVLKNQKALWVKKDGNIVKVLEPLYKEMALIDASGNEVIKIVNGKAAAKGNVGKEEYFTKTKALNKGETYLGHVTGSYVNKAEFEKGKRFEGILRFATPVYDKSGGGVLTLALDVRHLTQITDTIIPTQGEKVLKADASSGNYAYMVDNRGFLIAHPNDYHVAGLNSDGTPVAPLTAETSNDLTKKGQEVLNLNLLGYMDPNLPAVTKDAAAGNAGMKSYKFGGHEKFVAYAPIKFYNTEYPKPAGFGWVGMGVDVSKFNEVATATAQKIQAETKAWTTTIIVIIIISVVLLFLILALLAKGIARSIEAPVPEGSEAQNYDDGEE